MITECKSMKECREALYKAYEEDINVVLDLKESVNADEVPVVVGACTQCNADKVLGQVDIDTPSSCLVCGERLIWDHVIDMIVQGDVVVYRWQNDFEVGS